MQKRKVILITLFLFLAKLSIAGIKDDIARTIVRVQSGNKYSTGFFWNDGKTVLTTLHSIASTSNISVYIPELRVWKSVSIKKVFKSGDLISLTVNDFTSPYFISNRYTARPTVDTKGFTIGYNSGSTKYLDRDFTVGLLQGNTLDDLLPSSAKNEIRNLGFPSLSTEIVYLKASLLHGFSGSPIVDFQGRLMGVADGGLENGAAAISWCIHAGNISRLEASTESIPNLNQARINSLFAAEEYTEKSEEEEEEEYIELNNYKFKKIKTRTFAQLDFTGKFSSMDALGLNQLLLNFNEFNYRSFRYDVYLEETTGATIVVPADDVLITDNDMLTGGSGDVELFISLSQTGNIQNESINFEKNIMPGYYNNAWFPDVFWSYPMPYPGANNSFVRRRAYNTVSNEYYLFEALAAKENNFLGVAARRRNKFNPDYETKKNWAKYAIAIQLTSFSN